MHVVRYRKGFITQKWNLLIIVGTLTLVTGHAWADCWPTSSSINPIRGDVHSGTSSWNISSMLTSSDTVSQTTAATWSGAMYCSTVLVTRVYYVSPISNGYYVHFTDESNDIDQWVKFTSTPDTNSATATALYHAIGEEYLLGYDISAELVDSSAVSSDSTYSTETTSGSVTIPVAAMARSSDKAVADNALAAFKSGSWSSSDWIAYQTMTVAFSPSPTTCSVTDTTVSLPTISPTSLKNGNVGSTAFTIPLTCSNTLDSSATRNVSAWFYSADIVDGYTNVLRNSNSDSAGVGVKILNDSSELVFSNSAGVQNDATETQLVSKGDSVGSISFSLNAQYYVYDSSALASGSLTATAVLYLNYD